MEYSGLRRDWDWDRVLGVLVAQVEAETLGARSWLRWGCRVRRREQSPTLGEHKLRTGQREKKGQRSLRGLVQRGCRRVRWRPWESKAGVRDLAWAEVRGQTRKMRRREPCEAERRSDLPKVTLTPLVSGRGCTCSSFVPPQSSYPSYRIQLSL